MLEPVRVPPEEARKKVLSGEAMLVCAYEDETKFRRLHLEGAVSLRELKDKVASLSRQREIIFY